MRTTIVLSVALLLLSACGSEQSPNRQEIQLPTTCVTPAARELSQLAKIERDELREACRRHDRCFERIAETLGTSASRKDASRVSQAYGELMAENR